jgi:predicted lipid-binding transport protein (Tim44 family)
MNGFDIIFYIIFAAFMIYRLVSVLGKDEHSPSQQKQQALNQKKRQLEEQANIIESTFHEVEEDIPKHLKQPVASLQAADPSFRLSAFTQGAEAAFEAVIGAFCEGDKSTLKNLLDKHLYTTFSHEIDRRKRIGEIHECTIIAIEAVEVKSINLKRKQLSIIVEYRSQQVEMIKDAKGNVIEGDASTPENITDLWTFTRPLISNDPNWLLVQTHGM